MSSFPPSRAAAANELRRRARVHQRAGDHGAGIPAPVGVVRRPRTPTETVLLQGATLVGGLALLGGIAAVTLGWWGMARADDLQVQLAFLVSGSVAGVALVGVGCALLVLQAERLAEALENRAWTRLAQQWRAVDGVVADLVDHLDAPGGSAP